MRKEIIQRAPCATPIIDPSSIITSCLDQAVVTWYFPKPNTHIKDLPILLNDDNSPWEDGTFFLLSRTFDQDFNRTPLNIKTISRKADDLAYFRNALESLGIDYRADERFKMNRPTYAFATYLTDKVADGKLAQRSAARIIGTVVEFYKHRSYNLQATNIFPLWEEFEISRKSYDNKGVAITETCITTDLMRIVKKTQAALSEDPNRHYVSDEGRVKPLAAPQQKAVIETLYRIQNPEMLLGFLVSISTSARLQTTFTLRANAFKKEINSRHSTTRIHIGSGTNIDTKKNKRHYIDMPDWLFAKLQVYVNSERYQQRASKCQLPADQKYLFYSSKGNPYVTASNDNINKTRDGTAIRVFLSETLLPALSGMGHDFKFKFHDLRATYCMNRVDEGLELVEKGKTTLDAVMRDVRDAMGHSSLETTYGYMDYRNLNPVITATETEWSNKLVKDIYESLGEISGLH